MSKQIEKKCGLKNRKARKSTKIKQKTETYSVPTPMWRRMRFVGQ